MNVNIEKRYQLGKTIRSSTHMNIVEEFFFGIGGQSHSYDVKPPKNFIFHIEFVENA